jgi:hypothetical protein
MMDYLEVTVTPAMPRRQMIQTILKETIDP